MGNGIPKRAVVREEFVAITGNYIDALLLNSFVYWCKKEGAVYDSNVEHSIDGWLPITARKISKETMLGLSDSNIRRHIQKLVDLEFIFESDNALYAFDKTKQYLLNPEKISSSLHEKGYYLNEVYD